MNKLEKVSKIKKLENKIEGKGEVDGFIFTKKFENQKGYVYKVCTETGSHFEAFFKKQSPVCIDFKQRIYSDTETKEIYPKSNNFGVWAWTVQTLEKGIDLLS